MHSKNHFSLSHVAQASLAFMLSAAANAHAQSPAPANSQAMPTLAEVQVSITSEGSYADPVTSSATKLILTNRETPQSTTVITQRQMQDWAQISIPDVMSTVTGVYTSYGAGFDRPRFQVRGGSANLVQIDGVQQPPMGRRPAVMGDSVAYERMEVLRGANGLLTGSGDPTATINMIRKRATAKKLSGHVGLSAGSWNNYRAEFDLGTALNESGSVRGRVAGAWHDRDSFVDRYGKQVSTLYATVEANLAPRTLLRTGVEFTNTHTRGGINNNAAPYYWADGSLVNAPRGATGMSANWSDWPTKERTIFAGLEHGLDNGWFLNATASYNIVKMTGGRLGFIRPASGFFDPDGSSPAAPHTLGGQRVSSRFIHGSLTNDLKDDQKTLDVSAQGPFELAGRTHEAAVGFNAWSRTAKSYGEQTPPLVNDNWNYWTWSGNLPRYDFKHRGVQSRQKTDSQGVFAALRWNVADSVKVLTGARLTNHKVKTLNYNPDTGALTGVKGAASYKGEFTPYLGVVWDFHPNWSVYASYTDAFQPQNYFDANDQPIDPVIGRSFELGAKTELLDQRLNVSAAIYQSKLDNVGEPDTNYADDYKTPAGNRPYRSTGKGNTTTGVEFEASGEITPSWNIYAGLSHSRTKDGQGVRIRRDLPATILRLSTAYKIADSGWTVGGGLQFNGGYQVEVDRPTGRRPNNTVITRKELRKQSSVALINLMARYQVTPAFSVQMNVNNAFDKKYANTILNHITARGGVVWGEPRSFNLSARYKF